MPEFGDYTQELCKFAKMILKTQDSLNIDGYPLYYQMLENAFKLG